MQSWYVAKLTIESFKAFRISRRQTIDERLEPEDIHEIVHQRQLPSL
jgi:hypothetical protein